MTFNSNQSNLWANLNAGVIRYGQQLHYETKEEAIERVYQTLIREDYDIKRHRECKFSIKHDNSYSEDLLHVEDGKLIYKEHDFDRFGQDIVIDFKTYFIRKGEAPDVIDAVEAIIVKETNDIKVRLEEEAKRAKEEAKAAEELRIRQEQERRDAAKKAKYLSWKAEAERLGIPFKELCDMKRAEMEDSCWDD